MRYVIVDLEATCWENVRSLDRMETIEIGAVELLSATASPSREFGKFVRPVAEPKLSKFCTELTTIEQQDVDRADGFWAVFPEFMEWIGEIPFTFCSWGEYDLNQFRSDCRRHQIPFPASLEKHINLKKEFARLMNVKICGMEKALKNMKIPLEGTHHRGLDDARNIAKLAALILPRLESSSKLA